MTLASETSLEELMTFHRIHTLVRRIEGGYYPGTNKRDPNPTMWGVTQKTFNGWLLDNKQPVRPVKSITAEECEHLYWERFWRRSGAAKMAWPLNLVHYDATVNHGPKWPPVFLKDAPTDFRKYLLRRKRFYDACIVYNPNQEGNRNGWYNRLWVLSLAATDPVFEAAYVKTGLYPKRPPGVVVHP